MDIAAIKRPPKDLVERVRQVGAATAETITTTLEQDGRSVYATLFEKINLKPVESARPLEAF